MIMHLFAGRLAAKLDAAAPQIVRAVADTGFAGLAIGVGWFGVVEDALGLLLLATGVIVGILRIALMVREWRRGGTGTS